VLDTDGAPIDLPSPTGGEPTMASVESLRLESERLLLRPFAREDFDETRRGGRS
jgi:hypothetical protein